MVQEGHKDPGSSSTSFESYQAFEFRVTVKAHTAANLCRISGTSISRQRIRATDSVSLCFQSLC